MMPKIKLAIMIIVVSVAIAAVVMAGVSVAYNDNKTSVDNTQAEDDPVNVNKTDGAKSLDQSPPYLVKIYNGRVGIYSGGKTDGIPDSYIDTNLKLLSSEDILLLTEGVSLKTYEELLMLIEDITS